MVNTPGYYYSIAYFLAVFIRVENYCQEPVTFKNGIPVTTKKDKHLHGFGMKSIISTVKKYGGSVTAEIEENWFELRILIPLKSKM